jgi:hypothetical protein
MEKIYELLEWIDEDQAVNWLKLTTGMPITVNELLQFCEEGKCTAYEEPGTEKTQLHRIRLRFKTTDIKSLIAILPKPPGFSARSEDLRKAAELGRLQAQIEHLKEALEQATKEARAEVKPSYVLAIGALLALLEEPVKKPRPSGMNQSAIKQDILQRFPKKRGLSHRNLAACRT